MDTPPPPLIPRDTLTVAIDTTPTQNNPEVSSADSGVTEAAPETENMLTDAAEESTAELKKNSRLKVNIKHWYGVAVWRWQANDDSCGICRFAFDACCTDCSMPGDDCPLVWGQCSHCFHMHCIVKWLNSQTGQQCCPMCRSEWKFKE